MQTATGLVEQRDVLEHDRGLAGDLDVDLAVFLGQDGQRIGAERHHGGYRLVVDEHRQADDTLGPQIAEEGSVAPLLAFLEVLNEDRHARLQRRSERIALSEQGLDVQRGGHVAQDVQADVDPRACSPPPVQRSSQIA